MSGGSWRFAAGAADAAKFATAFANRLIQAIGPITDTFATFGANPPVADARASVA